MAGKKVIIIGAGIAGLSAACYLQMNGYETEIFDMQSKPGGLCMSWKRGEYTIDLCVRWLVGSSPRFSFYKIWKELIDMEKLHFVNHEARFHIQCSQDKLFHLYTDLNRLENYMKEISPGDGKVIEEFIGVIRRFRGFQPPVDKALELYHFFDRLKMIKYLPLMGLVKKWGKISNLEYSRRFQNPFLREVFEMIYEGGEYPLLYVMFQLAIMDSGSAGYPLGGSLFFANQIVEKYKRLGGKINYNSKVVKIRVDNDTATGIQLDNGDIHRADIVVSAADGHYTIFEMLEGQYLDKKLRYNYENLKTFGSLVYVWMGVKGNFAHVPYHLVFKPDNPFILPDGKRFDVVSVFTFNFDPDLAPEGKTLIYMMFETENYEYWTGLREQDPAGYKEAKEKVAREVIEMADQKLGNIKENVEVLDVATPATFIRYTGNWKGSYEGWFPSSDMVFGKSFKKTLPGLKNFYMAGQWVEPGGGLPPAILSGRNVTQIICRQDGKKFRVG
jgi:phytoene dehydrogenase-like protein